MSSSQSLKNMFRIILILTLIFKLSFGVAFGFEVKIVATVGNVAITSRDVANRLQILRAITPQITSEEAKNIALEKLIQEALLSQKAEEIDFKLSKKETESETANVIKQYPALKNLVANKEIHNSLKAQVVGEIVFSVLLQGQLRGKLDFTSDEVERFKNSYNEESSKRINSEEARQVLTSMKVRDVQNSLLKSLEESSLVERK
jgi:hypothetical protein